MIFNWRHFLSLAVRMLRSHTPSETEIRTAVGRAYYAAYLECCDLAKSRGLKFSGSKPSHEQVWQFFRSGGSATRPWGQAASKHVGDIGVALRAMRTQADYYLAPPTSTADAQRAVAMSQEILRRLPA